MTRVDFYVLQENKANSRGIFSCRLIEKIYKTGHKILLHVQDEQQAEIMDDLLWTWRQGSFIPHEHCQAGKSAESPVIINYHPEPETDMQDVLINLAPEVPLFFSQFDRVAEIIDQNEQTRQSGRERYRFYQERGYPLESHDIGTR